MGFIQHIKCEPVPIKENIPYPKKELVYFASGFLALLQ